ncbi:MAG TPA: AMP-binding protein [Rectinemataceae bacterium]|nr:AMP-binding protein [Rectinemataceae bacterium]
MKTEAPPPWKFLDEFRGSAFAGEWPTLPELFSLTAKRLPERACFTVYEPDRVSLSYAEALAVVERVAGVIRSLGIGRGDRVAVTGKNSPEWAVAYLAALFAGAVVVPIDYQLSAAEIGNLVRAGGASLLFSDEEKASELRASCPGLKGYFSLASGRENYIYSLQAAAAPAPASVSASAELPGEAELAAILFTSGTMGKPKGVMLTHRNLVSDCYLSQANLRVYPTDVFYALLPIHHSYTMLAVFIEAISVGAEVVFGKRMVIKQVLKDLKEAKITMFLGVPLLFNKVLSGILKAVREKGLLVYALVRTLMALSGFIKKVSGVNPGKSMFHSLLDKASLASIRICISGGGPLAPSVFRLYNQLGIDFVQGYGLTETSPIITLNPTDAYIETSVGRIVPRVEMKILDPDENGVGEIAVKGPMVMAGYYQMPEETAEVFTEDGWFKTGDLGYLDERDYVYLTGRAKNLIVTEGGKNVFPEEIENRFQLYDEVEQVLVRGYLEDAKMKSEGIEALLYPSAERFLLKAAGAAGTSAPAAVDWSAAEARLRHIVDEVNQKLLPYQKIAKVTVLRQRMEETTTKKVKRHALGV